jgi:acyl-[acyl carrier protein]--UDP-N-acetylglucosamine O-acyltransferase
LASGAHQVLWRAVFSGIAAVQYVQINSFCWSGFAAHLNNDLCPENMLKPTSTTVGAYFPAAHQYLALIAF